MNHKHPFFWLANGYIVTGLLAGLGLGIMAGPHIRQVMPRDPGPVSGMIGMCLILISVILNGVLYQKCKNVDTQRDC